MLEPLTQFPLKEPAQEIKRKTFFNQSDFVQFKNNHLYCIKKTFVNIEQLSMKIFQLPASLSKICLQQKFLAG